MKTENSEGSDEVQVVSKDILEIKIKDGEEELREIGQKENDPIRF